MPQRGERIDDVLKALADPTRRRVIERLVAGPTSTSELAEPFDMALPSFTQHLEVLERAGLVTSTKTGRVRTYRLAPAGLDAAEGWLADQRRLWERRLDQLDSFLVSRHDRPDQTDPPDQTHQPDQTDRPDQTGHPDRTQQESP